MDINLEDEEGPLTKLIGKPTFTIVRDYRSQQATIKKRGKEKSLQTKSINRTKKRKKPSPE
jgi:hypothetical protein